jgi:hypothetical protein
MGARGTKTLLDPRLRVSDRPRINEGGCIALIPMGNMVPETETINYEGRENLRNEEVDVMNGGGGELNVLYVGRRWDL